VGQEARSALFATEGAITPFSRRAPVVRKRFKAVGKHRLDVRLLDPACAGPTVSTCLRLYGRGAVPPIGAAHYRLDDAEALEAGGLGATARVEAENPAVRLRTGSAANHRLSSRFQDPEPVR
jgi:hypothetical protein